MATFCQPGDTARVTLPDGSIQNFIDTPITITCNPEYAECSTATVNYSFTYHRLGVNISGTAQSGIRLPFQEIRIRPTDNRFIEGFCRGNSSVSCVSLRWTTINSVANISSAYYTQVAIISIIPSGNPTGNRLIITGASGNQLFNQVFSSCNYSVECIPPGCPPGTLDCNDCCLNCDSVFNEISSLRALIKGLK
jgi:hypothetical protein